MTGLATLGGYTLVWMFTARWLYGRWRGILKTWADGDSCYTCRRRVASTTETAWRASLSAVVWPLVWLAIAITFRPPPTVAERAATEAKLKARVSELEREAGIRP